jgi:mono/diheme cytochrome c family protein
LVTACVDSSEEDAQTPASAPTVVNSALQTNSKGETITAPGATPPPATSGGGTPAPPDGGDAAAGETTFAASCSSCHLNDGKDAGGVGPQLAGAGLDAAATTDVLENGRPGTAMVGGLVSGEDLENVVAYVVSLQ